jgi:energy-coupling factor transporter ATP-binding protein EcfA2
MRFTFQTDYRSIKHLPCSELPDFSVLTGENGAGKTHFLKAVEGGQIVVEGVPTNKIQYYNWTTLAPAEEGPVHLRALEDEKLQQWQDVLSRISQHTSQVIAQLRSSSFPNISQTSLNQVRDQLLSDSGSAFSTEESAWLNKILVQASRQVKNQYSSGHQYLAIIESIEQKSGLPCIIWDETIFYNYYPLSTIPTNPFQGALARLFLSYKRIQVRNDVAEWKACAKGLSVSFLSQEEFLRAYGPPPWQVLNAVLEEANLNFRVEDPPDDDSRQFRPRLLHKSTGDEIGFSGLSDGERVLMATALFLFYSQDDRQPTNIPELILLDEVDAPLHPSMALSLIRTIENVIVGTHKRRVIMTTHSPSTVALAPEDSIFLMDAETRLIRKSSRDEGVSALTSGVPTLSIRLENRRQVFVESEHDVLFWERAFRVAKPNLAPEISLSFIAAGHSSEGGCDRVRKLVTELVNAGNKTVFGIVDWDLKNKAEGQVLIAGAEQRYSIENYVLDPILVTALLLREKKIERANVGLTEDETYTDIRLFDSTRLQSVMDGFLSEFGWVVDQEVKVTSVYANGTSVQIPSSFLKQNGHDLETQLKQKFPVLRRFHKEPDLKLEILEKILDDIPGLLPADITNLLSDIQVGSAK